MQRYNTIGEAREAARDCLQYIQGLPMSVFRGRNDTFYVLEHLPSDLLHPDFVCVVQLSDEAPQTDDEIDWDKVYDETPPILLSDDEIKRIVDFVKSNDK